MIRVLTAVIGILLAACSSGPPPPTAIVVNSPGTLVPGEVRLLIGLIDADGAPITEDVPATLQLFDPDSGELTSEVAAEFIWTVPDARGIYTALVNVDRPGVWGLALQAGDLPATEPTGVQVTDQALVPVPGQLAPRSVTPTGADFPLDEISTDPEPNPAFYEASLHESLGNGEPVIAVFSTPAFCTTATCGPTLDIVKSVAGDASDATFIHIEVYTNLGGSAAELEVVPSVLEWGLPSEPWVFVMDGEGVVVAAFEGALSADELAAAVGEAR